MGDSRRCTLLAFFKLSQTDPAARTLLYHDIRATYTYDKMARVFKRRRDTKIPVGRMYSAMPSQGDRFYLRTLFAAVPGARSFEELRTFEVCSRLHMKTDTCSVQSIALHADANMLAYLMLQRDAWSRGISHVKIRLQ